MRSLMPMGGSNNIVVVLLCSLLSLTLFIPLPVQGQVSHSTFELDNKSSDASTYQVGGKEVSIDSSPSSEDPLDKPSDIGLFLTNRGGGHTLSTRTLILGGVGVLLLLGGIVLSVRAVRQRQKAASISAGGTSRWIPPVPTEAQRADAVLKVKSIPGTIRNLPRSREYLARLQRLPDTVHSYETATQAINAVYILCRDTEKSEPVLSGLLTAGWRVLTDFQQSTREVEWRKSETDRFRTHLRTLTFETEALIQQASQSTSTRAGASANRES